MKQSLQKIIELKSADHDFNKHMLYALMAHPEDLEKRMLLHKALKLLFLKFHSPAQRSKLLKNDPFFQSLLERSLDIFWEKSLGEVVQEGSKNYNEAIVAGNMLLTTLSLGIHHEGYSFSKAKFLVEDGIKGKEMLGRKIIHASDRMLDGYKKKYCSIAHLAAAVSIYADEIVLNQMCNFYGKPRDAETTFSIKETENFLLNGDYFISTIDHFGFFDEKILDEVAQYAEAIRRFAITASPKAKIKPYLDKNKTWRIIPKEKRLPDLDAKSFIDPLLLKEQYRIKKDYNAKDKKIYS